MVTRSNGRGITFTLFASLLWASSFVATQLGLESVGPLLLLALRFEVAAPLGLALAAVWGVRTPTLAWIRSARLWGVAALYASGYGLQFVGQTLSEVASSTLLSNLFPAFVPLFAFPLLSERLTRRHAVAIGLSLIGLAIISGPGTLEGRSTFEGNLLLIGSALAFSLFVVLSKRYGMESPESALAIIVAMGALLTPILLSSILTGALTSTTLNGVWLPVTYLALACTVAALVLFRMGLRWVTAAQSGILLLLEPTAGLILAAAFFQSSVTTPVVVGALFVIGAIAAVCWQLRRAPRTGSTLSSDARLPDGNVRSASFGEEKRVELDRKA
ncbi:MAG: DMT family transporter [Thermoplasmata archaeon]